MIKEIKKPLNKAYSEVCDIADYFTILRKDKEQFKIWKFSDSIINKISAQVIIDFPSSIYECVNYINSSVKIVKPFLGRISHKIDTDIVSSKKYLTSLKEIDDFLQSIKNELYGLKMEMEDNQKGFIIESKNEIKEQKFELENEVKKIRENIKNECYEPIGNANDKDIETITDYYDAIDINYLIELTGNDKSLVLEILQATSIEINNFIIQISDKEKFLNDPSNKSLFHKIATSFKLIGSIIMYEKVKELEFYEKRFNKSELMQKIGILKTLATNCLRELILEIDKFKIKNEL